MIYAITYDLTKPGQNYPDLYRKIQSLGQTNHALQNLWLLSTNYSLAAVRDEIRKVIDSNDSVFVLQIYKGTYSAWVSVDVHNWLEARL